MNSSDSNSKFGNHFLLVGLGVLTTTLLSIMSISGDEEILVHVRPKREPSPILHRDAFSDSLRNAVVENFTPQLCEGGDQFFANFTISNSSLTPAIQANYWHKDLPDFEKEAFRRCELRQVPFAVKTCFLFSPVSQYGSGGFLKSDFVFVELYLSFRDARSRKGVPCKDIANRPSTQMTAYYSLHWPKVSGEKLYEFNRITGGFQDTIYGKLDARK